MEGRTEEAEEKREEMARRALRREVELQVDKKLLDAQARLLIETNYVYKKAHYRTDLVERLAEEPEVPEVFQACAKFVPVDAAMDDESKASGPASATTAGEQEREAASDDGILDSTPWLSLLDDEQTHAADISSLPALQTLLDKMEQQAGRIVANEVKAMLTEGGYGALDELGRKRLLKICDDFHRHCHKWRREDEAAALLDRIRCLQECQLDEEEEASEAEGNAETEEEAEDQEGNAGEDAREEDAQPKKKAQLRVPMTRQAKSWWDATYFTEALPTLFGYGDCSWCYAGIESKFAVWEWADMLWRREEMEYDLPEEEARGEHYVARPINRFRGSWYFLHLVASFWRQTETS